MKTNFTPGPWRYEGSRDKREIWGLDVFPVCADSKTSQPPGRVTIATPQAGEGIHSEEAYGNAILIAAAPELYTARCEMPIIRRDDTLETFAKRFKEWNVKYRIDAMKKARGE